MFNTITQAPEFGIFLTIGAYVLAYAIAKRVRVKGVNPMQLAIILGVIILVGLRIPYENYQHGGVWIAQLLGPASMGLVIPLYEKRQLFFRHARVILIGIFCGLVAGLCVTIPLLYVFDIPYELFGAVLAKNSTGPIALELVSLLEQPTYLVMLMVVISGLFGYTFGNQILNAVRIKHPVAKGIALGSCSHIVGTARAMENSPEEGAMGSLSILITGFMYLLVIPWIMTWLGI